jgi:hypothetical protein
MMTRHEATDSDTGTWPTRVCDVIHLDGDPSLSGLWRDVASVLARATIRLSITQATGHSDQFESRAA